MADRAETRRADEVVVRKALRHALAAAVTARVPEAVRMCEDALDSLDALAVRVTQLEEALRPIPVKCEHALYVGTEEQMRADLEYLARCCRAALAAAGSGEGSGEGTP